MTPGTAPAPDGPAPTPMPRFRGRALALTLGVASVFAIALASQVVVISTGFDRPVPWLAALGASLVDTWLWVPFVPLIFAIARRLPLHHRRWPFHVGLHLAAALGCVIVYTALQTAISEWVLPGYFQLGRHFFAQRPGGPGGPGGPGRSGPAESGASREPKPFERPSPNAFPPPDAGPPPDHDHPPFPGALRGGPGRGGGPRDRFRSPPTFADVFKFQLWTRWQTHLLSYAIIAGVWHWLAQGLRLGERERQTRELSRQLAEARLQALRMQLNPHFLFNTLNAIATLVHRAPRAADEMIACLSDFLRLTLNSSNAPESPLRTELEFARRYLEIEKARFGDRLEVNEDIEASALDTRVPTLVLQPLLENAIRHGIERQEGRGEIRLTARRDGSHLQLEVADTGPGLRPESTGGSGIGLANTRSRLRELHGDAAQLELADRPGGGLIVRIRLPWTGPAA